jgi:hypothetical protein
MASQSEQRGSLLLSFAVQAWHSHLWSIDLWLIQLPGSGALGLPGTEMPATLSACFATETVSSFFPQPDNITKAMTLHIAIKTDTRPDFFIRSAP